MGEHLGKRGKNLWENGAEFVEKWQKNPWKMGQNLWGNGVKPEEKWGKIWGKMRQNSWKMGKNVWKNGGKSMGKWGRTCGKMRGPRASQSLESLGKRGKRHFYLSYSKCKYLGYPKGQSFLCRKRKFKIKWIIFDLKMSLRCVQPWWSWDKNSLG